MKTAVNFSAFRDAFQAVRPDNFSYDGQKALFDYLEQFEQDTGQELELDVIAICCDFGEYESLDAAKEDYNDIESLEELEEQTTVLQLPGGGLVIQLF